MKPQTARLAGNIVLVLCFAILAVTMAGMAGWISKYWPTRPMIFFAFILSIVARRLRRPPATVSQPPAQL
jgi:hypothetical protein